jgi:hypothetical protein
MLWTTATFEALAIFMYRDGGIFLQQIIFLMVAFAVEVLLASTWLLLLVLQKAGREWLVTEYYDKDSKKMGPLVCFLVRAISVTETIAVVVVFNSSNR